MIDDDDDGRSVACLLVCSVPGTDRYGNPLRHRCFCCCCSPLRPRRSLCRRRRWRPPPLSIPPSGRRLPLRPPRLLLLLLVSTPIAAAAEEGPRKTRGGGGGADAGGGGRGASLPESDVSRPESELEVLSSALSWSSSFVVPREGGDISSHRPSAAGESAFGSSAQLVATERERKRERLERDPPDMTSTSVEGGHGKAEVLGKVA